MDKKIWASTPGDPYERCSPITGRYDQNSFALDVFVINGGITSGNSLSGLSYQITRGTLTDVVEYYSGGLAGTIVATFTATFDNPRKKNIVSGVWS